MKYRKKLCSAVLSAVILLSLAGCGEMPLPEGYKELPATIKAEDVVLDKNEPAYKRTEYYYKNDKLESTSVGYYDAYDSRGNMLSKNKKYETLFKTKDKAAYLYEYDSNDNLIRKESHSETGDSVETYEYDDMGRLTHRTTGSTEYICEYEELDN